MGTPVGVEVVPKEPPLHPSSGPPNDPASEDSSSDSSSDSGSESSNSSDSNSPELVKVKVSKEPKGKMESSASEADSESESNSLFEDVPSCVASEMAAVFKTPAAAPSPAASQAAPMITSPLFGIRRVKNQAVESVSQSSPAPSSSVVVPSQSPVALTPAKTLTFPTASPLPLPIHLPSEVEIMEPDKEKVVFPDHKVRLDVGPAEPVGVAPVVGSVNEAAVEVDFAQIEGTLPVASDLTEGVPSSSKSRKKKKSKKDSRAVKSSEDRKIEQYKDEVVTLEKALKRAEKDKKREKAAERKKGGKQPKGPPKRTKKRKASTSDSSDGEYSDSSSSSSSSSSASDPVPSERIARLPQGRQLQQLAMSRVKEQGFVKEGDLKVAEIAEALRIIDTIELNFGPDMACQYFFQVPGTCLPHMQKHIVSFSERYGALVRSVVKFHLLQIQRSYNEKRLAISAVQDAPLGLLWQFQNDLARTPAASAQVAPLPIVVAPLPTPKHKKASTKHSKMSRKSSFDPSSVVKSESRKRCLSTKSGKSARKSKKSKSGKKKRKREESSSDVSFCYCCCFPRFRLI